MTCCVVVGFTGGLLNFNQECFYPGVLSLLTCYVRFGSYSHPGDDILEEVELKTCLDLLLNSLDLTFFALRSRRLKYAMQQVLNLTARCL